MPKIRGIKPDFWTDEDIVDLSLPARLLYIGLWSYACDNGHLDDKPKQIKMRVLPADDCNVSELLRELDESGRIRRSDGVITIPNFVKHQKVDKRYFVTCQTPGCERPEQDSQHETRGGHVEPTSSPRRAHHVPTQRPHVDGDGDGDGDGDKRSNRARRAEAADADFDTFWATYPKRVGKGAAVKAWKSARAKAEAAQIIAGVKAALPKWTGTEARFIPNPATWLNQERWTDEATPTVAAAQPGRWW